MLYVEKLRAWRNEAGDRPTWVSDLVVVERRDGGLEISRHPAFRGDLLAPGEWLVLRPAGDFSIISDADFREFYSEDRPQTVYWPPDVSHVMSTKSLNGISMTGCILENNVVHNLCDSAPDLHIADTPPGPIFPDEGGPE